MPAQTVTCLCEKTFEAEVPDEINLDLEPEYTEAILNGSFLNFTCPHCGKTLKPEYGVSVISPKTGLKLKMIPELQRISFYNGKIGIPSGFGLVIGFPELLDRFRVIREKLDPRAVEIIKYFLLEKAQETKPDADISVYFHGKNGDDLVFHLLGLRLDEIAIMKVPLAVYEKTLADAESKKNEDPFKTILAPPYISAMNAWLED